MKSETINYRAKDEGGDYQSGSVTANMPENLQEAVQVWGEDVVLSKAKQSVVIDIQGVCRRADNPDKAQEAVDSYIPGVSRGRVSGGVSQKAMLELIKNNPALRAQLEEMAKEEEANATA